MPICKTCNIKYHHCSSCGYSEWYNEDVYCSEKCAMLSEEYKDIKQTIESLLDKLDEDGKAKLAHLLYDCDPDITDVVVREEFKGKIGMEGWGLW